MRTAKRLSALLLLNSFLLLQVGCGSPTPADVDQPIEMDGPPPAVDDGHDHAGEHQGPHGGHVVELGRSHEFHAEIVEDAEAKTVTVYMLGKDLQELPIEQQEIMLSVVVDGAPRSFAFSPTNAADGKASQFQSSGDEAFVALHEHGAAGKLLVKIGGKSYSGEVEHHDHGDHAGHDH